MNGVEGDIDAGGVEIMAGFAVVGRFELVTPRNWIKSTIAVANCCTVECDKATKGGGETVTGGTDNDLNNHS